VYRLLHGFKHFLDQIQKWLYSVGKCFRLVSQKVHDDLHAQYRIVFVLQLDEAHKLVRNLHCMRFERVDGVHGESVQDLEDAIPNSLCLMLVEATRRNSGAHLFRRCRYKDWVAVKYLEENRHEVRQEDPILLALTVALNIVPDIDSLCSFRSQI
jgi:hypothetical protein